MATRPRRGRRRPSGWPCLPRRRPCRRSRPPKVEKAPETPAPSPPAPEKPAPPALAAAKIITVRPVSLAAKSSGLMNLQAVTLKPAGA